MVEGFVESVSILNWCNGSYINFISKVDDPLSIKDRKNLQKLGVSILGVLYHLLILYRKETILYLLKIS